MTPLSGLKAPEREGAVADPDKAQSGMADRGGHAAHLAIPAFAERELEPSRGDVFPSADRRRARRKVGFLL